MTLELVQRDLERCHREELQRIGFAPRVQVMVGYVELIEGMLATLDKPQERAAPSSRSCASSRPRTR